MRRRLLFLSVGSVGGAALLALSACGADAVGVCDFGECIAPATNPLFDAGFGEDSTVIVPSEGGSDGGAGEAGNGGDGSTSDGNVADAGACGADANVSYCSDDAGCVDTLTSAQNCGVCGHACAEPDGSGEIAACVGGSCTFACTKGYHPCNGECLPNTDDPTVDTCLLSDTYGVFVVSGGTGTGTQASPLGSIGSAMALAASTNRLHVFVCAAGTYTAPLSVGTTASGVAVSGGFTACPATGTWAYTSGTRSVVAPTATGLALTVTGASAQFFDMEFDAKDGANPGDSSIAAFLASAPSASFTRSALKAGNGQGATDAQPIAAYAGPSTTGNPGAAGNGGGQVSVACTNGSGTTVGGAGGQPTASGSDGLPGTPAITPADPPTSTGAGGAATSANCGAGSSGINGSDGAGGTSGAGAAANGSVTPSGWSPTASAAGGNGGAGQGGGGGASLDGTGGGGGGGAGGCGGSGGPAGPAGGSSIALLVYDSPAVTITSSTLTAGTAGSGGNGAAGQVGQLGGNAGAAASTAECNGGAGGIGGSGGGGGGGAAGISAAIGWTGTIAPTTSSSTTLSVPLGLPAAGGQAGGGGTAARLLPPASNGGATGTQGQTGVIQQVVQLP